MEDEGDGLIPIFPVIEVTPVTEIPVFASTAKLPAVPSGTGDSVTPGFGVVVGAGVWVGVGVAVGAGVVVWVGAGVTGVVAGGVAVGGIVSVGLSVGVCVADGAGVVVAAGFKVTAGVITGLDGGPDIPHVLAGLEQDDASVMDSISIKQIPNQDNVFIFILNLLQPG